jgi:hypothetical protein
MTRTPPPDGSERVDIVTIHAETSAVPRTEFPWHVHLCLDTPEFDKMIAPPADVRLILYQQGSLHRGWRFEHPIAALDGSLTGQNLTERNPRAVAGVQAEWQAAGFSITEDGGVLVFGPARPPKPSVTTQAVFSLNRSSNPEEILFSEAPRVEVQRIPGERTFLPVDPDMKRFYKKSSRVGDQLIHTPVVEHQRIIRVPAGELREVDRGKVQQLLSSDRPLAIRTVEDSETNREKRHPFIVRNKYRIK